MGNVVDISQPIVKYTDHRRNFVCDDGDMSPPLLKVVVTVTTTFFKVEFAIFQAILSFTILQFYAQPIFPHTLARESYFSCYQKRSVA